MIKTRAIKNYNGFKFGEITIIREMDRHIQPNGNIKRMVEGICKCGNIKTYRLADLKSGNSTCCGHNTGKKHTHGMSDTRFYYIWNGIQARIYNPKEPRYQIYGARGIKCEWKTFEDFYKDMKDGYREYLTIDRIDVNGHYCKENCRWATQKEQCRNKRNNRLYKGKAISYWIEKLGLTQNVYSRLNRGWTEEEALYGKN